MKYLPGEKDAINSVIKAAEEFGYGNLIHRLKDAWSSKVRFSSDKLGPLEFKAEDFEILGGTAEVQSQTDVVETAAKIANRLLTERLEKALEVFQCDELEGAWFKKLGGAGKLDTHSGRLVCIEKLEEK